MRRGLTQPPHHVLVPNDAAATGRRYWLNLFTYETWLEFEAAGAEISG